MIGKDGIGIVDPLARRGADAVIGEAGDARAGTDIRGQLSAEVDVPRHVGHEEFDACIAGSGGPCRLVDPVAAPAALHFDADTGVEALAHGAAGDEPGLALDIGVHAGAG